MRFWCFIPSAQVLRRTLGCIFLALAELGGTTVFASEEPALLARPLLRDGQAQVVPAFEDPSGWVWESLWVETESDSDGDGRRDRVFTDVARPGQTETEGLKVPVIYESPPYFAGTAEGKGLYWDVRQEVSQMPPARTDHTRVPYQPGRTNVSDGLLKTWVPRGFDVAHSDAPGMGLSACEVKRQTGDNTHERSHDSPHGDRM